MAFNFSAISNELSMHTSFIGAPLWALILLCIILLILLLFCSFYLIFICCFGGCITRKSHSVHCCISTPPASKDVLRLFRSSSALDKRLLSRNASDIEMNIASDSPEGSSRLFVPRVSSNSSSIAAHFQEIADRPWGICYSMREVKNATNEFADENVIGFGDNGIVYCGIFLENTVAAVKKLRHGCISCRGELREELRTIGLARHKNLVKLMGYCIEEDESVLVNEYVANGNLHQHLHESVAEVSPLTWSRRMNIILGVARGLAYLHDGIEPKITHQNLKATNVMLDLRWNPKICDFGIARLLTRTKRTPGSAPECFLDGSASEKSDVYRFGILVMEIISGRIPIDYSKPQVHLIDWLKMMIIRGRFDEILDPRSGEAPEMKELKRILLISLRCVDLDEHARPKMRDVIHMLEPHDLLFNGEKFIR